MLKTSELLELTDEDLLALIGNHAVIRVRMRNQDWEPPEGDEDVVPIKDVVTAGRVIEIQYSASTGNAVVTLFQGGPTADELKWDLDEYEAEFTWAHTSSDEN